MLQSIEWGIKSGHFARHKVGPMQTFGCKDFFYHKELKSFSVDASESQLWIADAMHNGFNMRSERTGVVKHFKFVTKITKEGDTLSWEFSDGEFKLTVFND